MTDETEKPAEDPKDPPAEETKAPVKPMTTEDTPALVPDKTEKQ